MDFGIVLLLLALVLGYQIRLRQVWQQRLLGQLLLGLTLAILALMGYGLGTLEQLGRDLMHAVQLTLTFLLCIAGANLLLLFLCGPRLAGEARAPLGWNWRMLFESALFAGAVIAGLVLGAWLRVPLDSLEQWASGLLYLLLLLVGMQLRCGDISLKSVLLNRQGFRVALLVIISAWAGGALAGWWLDLPLYQALALASGFGWYSLSGILVGDQLGPVLGSTAFLLDLGRELLAIVLIPLLVRRSAAAAIGLGGATSLDFTLPVIERCGGVRCVPVAVSSGFILSLAVPVLIPLFLGLA